jgi:hypothetical protein
MSCENWEQAIALSVDGEPSPQGLEAHLAQCATCRDWRDGLLADRAALRRWPAAADLSSPDLHAAIMRSVRRPRVSRFAWCAAAAAIVLVFLAIRFRPAPVSKPIPNPSAIVKPVDPPLLAPPTHVTLMGQKRHVKARARRSAPAVTDGEWRRLLDEFLSGAEPPARRAPASDVAIRIQTSDPDVVILWLEETREGGGDE